MKVIIRDYSQYEKKRETIYLEMTTGYFDALLHHPGPTITKLRTLERCGMIPNTEKVYILERSDKFRNLDPLSNKLK